MAAVGLPPVCAADGADGLCHLAAHRHFPEDAALNGGDQRRRLIVAEHVGPQHQPPHALRLLHGPGVDPGRLAVGRPPVIHDHGLPHIQLGQPVQGRLGEPLLLPVHLVVAGGHPEHKDLLLRQLLQGLPVDEGQLFPGQGLLLHPGRFLDCIHNAITPFYFHTASPRPPGG